MLVISSERLQHQPQAVLAEILQFIVYPTTTTATVPTTSATTTSDGSIGGLKARNRNRAKGSKASYSALHWLNNITYIESLTSMHFPSKYSLRLPYVTYLLITPSSPYTHPLYSPTISLSYYTIR